jgi:hypothetical protein
MISYLFFGHLLFSLLNTDTSQHANFLNKKIEMYDKKIEIDELALVVGKDMATGSFSKGVTNVDRSASNTIDLDNDLEEVSLKKQTDSLNKIPQKKESC